MAREKIFPPTAPMAFGEPGAKQSQDDKPYRVLVEPVRTASVEHGIWSHLSLRSRSGMEISQAWPLLTGLIPAQLIPARPFGLGWRFDEALLVTPSFARKLLAARSIKPTPQGPMALAQTVNKCNRFSERGAA